MSTELNQHMQKLKDMGIAGIYYEKDDAPTLTPSELAEVTRFGIHEEDQEEGL